MSDTEIEELSARELEILNLVATGATNREIAGKLYISHNTVKVHVRNIYSKIGVASRTEATLYAIREGLVEVDSSEPDGGEVKEGGFDQEGLLSFRTASQLESFANTWFRFPTLLWAAIPLAMIIVVAALFFGMQDGESLPALNLSSPPAPTPTAPTWTPRAELPVARSGMAVAALEGHIYAIAGETEAGLTSRVERYDPISDRWEQLADKPVRVADVEAAVISREIYVPGGRGSSEEIENVLEIYDPETDSWRQGAPLPQPLSAYAMVPFEGRLYVFGGWDGNSYQDTVYEYDPRSDQWRVLTPMPSSRGYAGAAALGGSIYVIGGTDGDQALAVNEEFLVAQEDQSNPWMERSPLPEGRYGMGITSAVGMLYVVGGEGNEDSGLESLVFSPQQGVWKSFDILVDPRWSQFGMVILDTQLYALGGIVNGTLSKDNLSFQVLYSVVIPIVVP